jgi:GntR family transcriptional regulator
MAEGAHPAGRQPAYLAIASELRVRIEQGEMAPHAPVPSERDLSQAFGVSRMTARHAVGQLEKEGYVYRRPPRGTFVAEPRIPLRIGSFTDEIVRGGRRPGAEVIWAETHHPTVAVREALDLRPGERVHGLQRLRRANGEPLAVETTYFPEALCPDLLAGPLDGSLWAALRERAGIVPVRAAATIEAVAIDEASAGRLGVAPGSSGILLIRRSFDADERCFEVARDLYRADRAEFHIDARIPNQAGDTDPARLVTVRPPAQ